MTPRTALLEARRPPVLHAPEDAARLLDRVDADPTRTRCAWITGQGGCGKSALLTSLAESYRRADIDVFGIEAINARPPAGAVFVDDAHRADPALLVGLQRLLTAPRTHVFVATRPVPRSPELSDLFDSIRREGHVVRLEHLGRDAVERWAAAALEMRVSASVVDLLHAQTAGLPSLIDEVLDAWHHDPATLSATTPVVPNRVVDRLRQVLDDGGAEVRDVLRAAAIGCELDNETVAAVLEMETSDAGAAIAAARATGYLPDGQVVPLVAAALLGCEAEATRTMRTRLLRLRHEHQRDAVPLARTLARTGVHDGLVAEVLIGAGDQALPNDPVRAFELYADAVGAGAPSRALALRRTESAARSGRFDSALQLVDPVLADVECPEFAAGMELAAMAMAHLGQSVRAAELYEWFGQDRITRGSATAAIALMGTGREGAAALLDAAPPEPTLVGGGLALMARGLQASLDDEAANALLALSRSAGLLEAADPSVLLPESPAALASLIAIHCGDLDLADSAVTRAIERNLGGPAFSARHRLLSAWVSMLRGHYRRVTEVCSEVEASAAPGGLTLRDELLVRALGLGVARRTSDAAGLVAAWKAGQEVLLRHPVDLFMLLPLGEFAVAAARLRQSERVRSHLDDAWNLLDRLGGPHIWETTLRWCGVQAAILRNRPDEVEPHAAALLRAAPHSELAAALATAGRAWVQTLAGTADPSTVEPAARGLQEFGLSWDGSRLLAQAAAHSNDRQTIAALLHAARSLQQVDDSPRETARDGSASTPRRLTSVLSEREREVASLLVQRLTYREIGQRLFISAKTVEHHVARIKQRLGASGRADLLARLPSTIAEP